MKHNVWTNSSSTS